MFCIVIAWNLNSHLLSNIKEGTRKKIVSLLAIIKEILLTVLQWFMTPKLTNQSALEVTVYISSLKVNQEET